MITQLVFTNPQGFSVTLNDLTYPLKKFTWPPVLEGSSIPKGQHAGQWDNYKHVRKMDIECEGTILTGDTTAYWVARRALMKAILPSPISTSRIHGTFVLNLDGDSTTYIAEVNLMQASLPLEALFPTVTEFMFTWECNKGYWRNQATGAEAFI